MDTKIQQAGNEGIRRRRRKDEKQVIKENPKEDGKGKGD